jgi:hypothetical protein
VPPDELNVTWQYSENTTTTGLRRHLVTYHRTIYLETCLAKGWTAYAAKLESADGDPVDSGPGRPLVPFTQKGLVDHLLKFIVADDQVSQSFLSFTFDR